MKKITISKNCNGEKYVSFPFFSNEKAVDGARWGMTLRSAGSALNGTKPTKIEYRLFSRLGILLAEEQLLRFSLITQNWWKLLTGQMKLLKRFLTE